MRQGQLTIQPVQLLDDEITADLRSAASVEPDKYGQQVLLQAADRIDELRASQISAFYEGERPVYRQGAPEHELEELLTAENVEHLVAMIVKRDEDIKRLREKNYEQKKQLRRLNEALQRRLYEANSQLASRQAEVADLVGLFNKLGFEVTRR